MGDRPNTGSSTGRAPSTRLVWILAWVTLEWDPKPRMPATPAGLGMAERPWWADRTAMALLMMGQRFASSCSLDMDPPPPQCDDDATWGRALVERALRVAGDDFFRNGHTALDCRRTESMANVVRIGKTLGVGDDREALVGRVLNGSKFGR